MSEYYQSACGMYGAIYYTVGKASDLEQKQKRTVTKSIRIELEQNKLETRNDYFD